jgi:anti-sigma-K factor RskA
MRLPTGPGHERWGDTSGAYVLGALAPEETDAYREHLDGCAACRAEVGALEQTVAALPASVPPRQPPAALRDRVMADVHREASLLAAAGSGADRLAPARRRWSWTGGRRAGALVAAALLIGLVAGIAVAGLGGGPRTISAGANARLVIDDGHATLIADHMAAPPAGRVYQVWIQPHGGVPEPTASLFLPRADGSATVAVPDEVADAEVMMVSSEPPGGSAAPTSAPVMTVPIS